MQAILLYLLKANVVLALFAAAYYGLLRRLTFFGLNRGYLLVALVFAAVYPALPMPGLLPAETMARAAGPAWVVAEIPTPALSAAAQPAASTLDWAATGLLVYAMGVGLLLARLLVQLAALARLRRTSHRARTATGVAYRQLPAPGDPFSFGHTIYLHAGQYSAAELAVVLAHEQAHVRQHHTLDVLLAHLGTALFWVNPAAWLLRRALLDNLEYLADAATLRTGLDRRAYQYCLLQLSRGPVGPALALPFSFLTLKNRVAMMNTPLSSRGQLAHYLLAGPLVMLAALGYSAAHARSAAPAEPSTASLASLLAPPPSLVMAQAASITGAPAPTANKPNAEAKKLAFALPLAARTYPQARITDKLYKMAGTAASPPSPANLVAPQPATRAAQSGPDPLCYLDGQVITMAQFKALSMADLYHTKFFESEQARRMASEKGYNGLIVATSRANRNTASVVEFNQRMDRLYAPPIPANSASLSTSLPTEALYYLNGQPSTKQAVEQLIVRNIADIDVVSDPARIHRIPGLSGSLATSVVLVTTRANEKTPAVQDFANKADLASAYTFRPVGMNVLVPAALAYITSHYPNARLNEVQEQTHKTTGAVKYQVQLINGKRPFYVYFSPQGEFAGEELH